MSTKLCFHCVSKQHLANYPKCPAKGVQFNYCKKSAHFAKASYTCQSNHQANAIQEPNESFLKVDLGRSVPEAKGFMCTVKIPYNPLGRVSVLS